MAYLKISLSRPCIDFICYTCRLCRLSHQYILLYLFLSHFWERGVFFTAYLLLTLTNVQSYCISNKFSYLNKPYWQLVISKTRMWPDVGKPPYFHCMSVCTFLFFILDRKSYLLALPFLETKGIAGSGKSRMLVFPVRVTQRTSIQFNLTQKIFRCQGIKCRG